MENPTYYAILPAVVRYDRELTDKAKLLYAEISVLTNKTGQCWAGNQYFASLYNVTSRTVTRLINELVDKGYLYRKYEYKGKEISKRILSVVPLEVVTKMSVPLPTKMSIPPDTNVADNTTSVNNTRKEIYIRDNNDFSRFWDKLVGRKLGKNDALKAYVKIDTELTAEELAEKFNRLLQVREEKYVPYPQKWLKNEGWNEEITIGERRADFHHDAPTLQNTEQETNIQPNENEISDVPDANASQTDLCKHYIKEYDRIGNTKMANYYRDLLQNLQEEEE